MSKVMTSIVAAMTLAVTTTAVLGAIPGRIILPTNLMDWYDVSGSPFHRAGGGIGGADDTYALDLNRPNNADDGHRVYSIADGFIERNVGGGNWANSDAGQLLIKHFNPDGTNYYCGYLHMRNITSLKSTQGAYVRAGTQIGIVSNVFREPISSHLHFACYDLVGSTLRSRLINTLQVNSRPNVGITGNITINNQVVNRSPFPVPRNKQFLMTFTVQNFGSETSYGNYYLLLTRASNGSQYVARLDDFALCSSLRPNRQLRVDFDKSSISNSAGIYWLQIYQDDCSSGPAALKRVTGAPVSVRLE